jgi:hypothetical protein
MVKPDIKPELEPEVKPEVKSASGALLISAADQTSRSPSRPIGRSPPKYLRTLTILCVWPYHWSQHSALGLSTPSAATGPTPATARPGSRVEVVFGGCFYLTPLS